MDINLQLVSIILYVVGVSVCQSANITQMQSNIQVYFSKPRHHETNKADKLKAKQFIHGEFKRSGLDTEVQEFTDRRYPKATFANIIGVLQGKRFGNADDKILGVSAHYDTVDDSPGVNDNGGGVAAMLEVVRQVTEANKKGTKRNNTIIFIAFDAEELSLMGGFALTKSWLGPYLVKHYTLEVATKLVPHGVIVMDTVMNYDPENNSQSMPEEYKQQFQEFFPDALANIAKNGFKGNFLLLTYRKSSTDSNLASSFLSVWNQLQDPQFEIESFPLPSADTDSLNRQDALDNFMRSDHVAFWYDRIPAIFLSDSAYFRGIMKQCYHKPCDKLGTFTDNNFKFLGKTADSVTRTLDTLSEALEPPETKTTKEPPKSKTAEEPPETKTAKDCTCSAANSRCLTDAFHSILLMFGIVLLTLK